MPNDMPIGKNHAAVLHDHVLSLEQKAEAIDDARADFNERIAMAKADGFDTNIVKAILKRRKQGEGATQRYDDLLQEYEDALAEQKRLPFARGGRDAE